MAGLINVGILKPELASSFATGFQQAEDRRNALAQQEQQNKLMGLQLQTAEQDIADRNALRAASQADILANPMKYGKSGLEYAKSIREAKTAQLGQLKTVAELLKNESNAVFAKPTLENAISRLKKFSADTGSDVTLDIQHLMSVGDNSEAIRKWAAGHALSAKDMLETLSTKDTGGAVIDRLYDPITGKITEVGITRKTATPGEIMTDARARQRLAAETETGQYSPETIDFLAQQYIYTGQIPALGIGKKASEIKMKLLDRARQITTGAAAPATPGAEPGPAKTSAEAAQSIASAKQTRAAEQSTLRDFSSGMSARRVTANNTAINHLETMDKLAGDLANMDTRVFNRAANTLAKELGSAPPANFDAAKQLVASEVIKAVVQNGGGVTERQEAAENFARANSPEQLKGVINTYKELLGGQLQSLEKQYEVGTNRKDFKQRLTPNTRKVLEHGAGTSQTATGKWEVVR